MKPESEADMKEKIPVTLEIENIRKHKSRFDFEEVAEELFGEMRDMTPEESEAHEKYLSSVCHKAGVNIWDLVDNGNYQICRSVTNKVECNESEITYEPTKPLKDA